MNPTRLTANGFELNQSEAAFGEFEEAGRLLSDPIPLQNKMHESGYPFFKQLLDPEIVLKARLEVMQKFAILGEVDDRFAVSGAKQGNCGAVRAAYSRAFSELLRRRYQLGDEPVDSGWNDERIEAHGGSRVFYPGLGKWNNVDFQDEWKRVDEFDRLREFLSAEKEIGG